MRLIAFMLTISVSACVPVIYKQHSIEFLQQPGLKFVKFGKRDIDKPIFRLEVPLEYELTRDAYSIHLEIVDGVRVYTKALDAEGNLLGIMGNPVPVTRSGIYCSTLGLPLSKDRVLPKDKILIYTWSSHRSACFSEEDTKVLSFSVLDEGGNLMGTESLPFDVKISAFKWGYDAI